MSRVFISYSRKDIAFVERLAKDIKNAGFDAWYDLSGLEAGKNWGKEIQDALQESQFLIVVLSPNSLQSRWVEREYLFAESLNVKIIPVLYQPCRLPLWTIDLHYIDMTSGSYKKHLEELLKVLGKPEPSVAQPVAESPPLIIPSPVSTESEAPPVPSSIAVEKPKPIFTPKPIKPTIVKEEQPEIPPGQKVRKEQPERRPLRKLRWVFYGAGGLVVLFLIGMIITGQFGPLTFHITPTQTVAVPTPTTSNVKADISGEISLWYNYDPGSAEEKAFLKNIDRASNEFKGVKIHVMQVDPEWIYDKYQNDFATSTPDLCLDCAEWLVDDVKNGMFGDLTQLTKDRLQGYHNLALDALTVDGKLYGLPLSFETMVMWYNKEKLPDPPQDTDTLQNLMLNGTPVAMDFQCDSNYGLLTALGAQIFDSNWTVIADQGRGLELGIDYISRLHAIARDRDWLPFETFGYGKFETESIGAVINSTGTINEYRQALGEKLAVTTLPKGDAGAARPFLDVKGIYLNPKSKNPEAAVAVALFLSDGDAQKLMADEANQIPAREDVDITDPLLKQLVEVVFSGFTPEWNASPAKLYWDNFCNYEDVFEAKVTPVEWVKEASAQARRQQADQPITFPIGTQWSSFKDLGKMMFVPEGEFIMGGGNGPPQFKVYLDGFWIDRTEVTVGQYEQCIAAKSCEGPANNPVGSGNFEEIKDLPVEGVSWKMANQYCTWVGERLPTEAEWEKAARGTDGRTYPWGEGTSEARANFNNQVGHTTAVGSYEEGKSPYGVFDMSGNVMEWVADWLWDYPTNGETLKNPTGPASGTIRILRGGMYADSADNTTATVRKMVGQNDTGGGVGFRCAVSVQDQFNLFEEMVKDPPITSPGDPWAPIWNSNYPDGKAMIYIQAGNFTMGSDEDETANPAHEVYLSAYWIDGTEITNGEYRKCEEEGACAPPKQSASFTRQDYYLNPDYEGYPVIWVTRQMAQDYCSWAGRRLPTEAEWEKAARGPYKRKFPWGNEFDVGRTNALRQKNDTTHVGDYKGGMSVYGVSDMAGNVWEWVADFFDASYYSRSATSNPTGPTSGDQGIIRGGCFVDDETTLTTFFRGQINLTWSEWSTGFRCAVTNPQE